MATTTMNYGSWTSLTITLASLATDADLAAGRESTVVDNTSNKFMNVLCGGKITTGTSPTAGKTIQIYVYGDITGTTEYGDLSGSDAALDFVDEERRDTHVQLAHVINATATSDQTYWVKPFGIARLFDGVMPQKWGLWIVHDTAVNLNSTGSNHAFSYIGIKYDSA